MKANMALSFEYGRPAVSAYLSARVDEEVEVRVYETSLMASLTSMIHKAESMRNMMMIAKRMR